MDVDVDVASSPAVRQPAQGASLGGHMICEQLHQADVTLGTLLYQKLDWWVPQCKGSQ